MGARVAVAGASGYAGGELLRLLAGHPELEIAAVTAGASAGQTVAQLHPHLAGSPAVGEQTLQPHDPAAFAGCDLIFLALPVGESAAVARAVPDSVKIVDLGPDFRLADAAAWERHYTGSHAGRWVTGLPELPGARHAIRAASRVAAPGCYATAAMLALVPLVAAGLADPADVVVVAASGTSGAGRSLRADLLASEVMGSVSAYAAGGAHRHTPEIEQALAEAAARGQAADVDVQPVPAVGVSFTPVLAPMPRGILATCTARLTAPAVTPGELRQAIAEAYAGEPFITVLPAGSWPATASVAGSNGVHLQAAADERAGRAVVVAAIDNLGKGAAGQAIQDANLMLGLPETAGLTAIGVAP
ncbi:MAG TPA: N-acetyl-gamma-glutamyl-phosphate reductase [Streptosporangiaceae bacterium]|nr:N-acetyl-gamma-glutamyl-phosphate reductase [Streptosporangiaceae bacterium]